MWQNLCARNAEVSKWRYNGVKKQEREVHARAKDKRNKTKASKNYNLLLGKTKESPQAGKLSSLGKLRKFSRRLWLPGGYRKGKKETAGKKRRRICIVCKQNILTVFLC